MAVSVQSTFVADTKGMLVVAHSMSTDELFVACLIGLTVTGDAEIIASEPVAFRVTADECCHGKATVAACSDTVNYNQIVPSNNSLF